MRGAAQHSSLHANHVGHLKAAATKQVARPRGFRYEVFPQTWVGGPYYRARRNPRSGGSNSPPARLASRRDPLLWGSGCVRPGFGLCFSGRLRGLSPRARVKPGSERPRPGTVGTPRAFPGDRLYARAGFAPSPAVSLSVRDSWRAIQHGHIGWRSLPLDAG